ncbi:MAG: nuclear transport factor 2 family protein [Xanthobacteraceae bacterium]|nr:nuclear transport factor 2 family protein [Xanthobacteraceae bacterium]
MRRDRTTIGAMFSRVRIGLPFIVFALQFHPVVAIADDAADIRSRLRRWTESFNSRDKVGACDLFSKSLVSDVQGQGEASYETRCATIGKALDDPQRSFHYSLNIKDIIVDKTLAVVRLNWTLKISPGDIVSTEIGLDVFRKENDGRWRIVRFIAYDPAFEGGK